MRSRRFLLSLLLVIPYIAFLWVSPYSRMEPTIAGFPFFYVWLLIWIVLTSLLTWLVFRWWRS